MYKLIFKMRKVLLISILSILIMPSAFAENDNLTIGIAGSQEKVLSVIKKAMEKEFSDGSIENVRGRVGYLVRYHSFFTDNTEIGIILNPITNNYEFNNNAFKLEIFYRMQSDSRSHMQGVIRDLKKEVLKQSSATSDVSIIENLNGYKLAAEQSNDCYKNISNTQDLQQLGKKVALGSSLDVTLSMLVDDSKVNDDEKILISKWTEKRDACEKIRTDISEFYPNDERVIISKKQVSNINQLIVDLYTNKITFGEFNKFRKEIALNAQSQMQEVESKRNVQQRNDQDTETRNNLERQRLGVEVLKSYQQNQVRPYQLPMPNPYMLPTRPMSSPQTTNCTSRVIGNTVQTQCN
jgi:hypothetical protein